MQMNREGSNIRIPGNEMPKTRTLKYDHTAKPPTNVATALRCSLFHSGLALRAKELCAIDALIMVPGSFCLERGPHCGKNLSLKFVTRKE
jgi:hypothetical protein